VLDKPIGKNARYINLGTWLNNSMYAVWDGQNLSLQKFDG